MPEIRSQYRHHDYGLGFTIPPRNGATFETMWVDDMDPDVPSAATLTNTLDNSVLTTQTLNDIIDARVLYNMATRPSSSFADILKVSKGH